MNCKLKYCFLDIIHGSLMILVSMIQVLIDKLEKDLSIFFLKFSTSQEQMFVIKYRW